MAERRRERKVVTVLFCDLVGFTSRAESLDPEDVEALLGPYHQRVRSELERYGGTVEKFIGDAVMALFGAPLAHEDDPERAVRAALAIREFAAEETLELRIGITTGEALVRLDAQPGAGEGMASGDVVNTAARLQSAAPVNGVIVDEATYRATRQAIDYREMAPVEAKGKTGPIAVWEAAEARSRFGPEVLDHVAADLVGRERELAALRAAFERVRDERSSQFVTLVGVPGIGKSRLLHELARIVDAQPELTTWRQGRCLAYGDGVTFWALSEIVKAQAGILEADGDETAKAKLHEAVVTLVDAEDASWVEAQLRPLAGLAEESELGGDQRGQAFAAWRRFFDELAAERPLVLVFEDLQWADDGLLDFVDELVDWTTGVPLFVVCTARPELLARRPAWGGGKLNASTIALEPLSDDETARLMGQILESPVLPADVHQTLLDRAGGNPLYAEQFAQLYVERGSAEELPLPETLQGIIAARLDDLPAGEKALLQSASVVGKVFWSGSLDPNGREIDADLHILERKGFIRRQRRSSVAGETELAFAHALVRDVAYGQIPRGQRVDKHRLVADWFASLGRPEDHAEMLAYHWRSALELAEASGGDTAELADRTRLALRDAGDRAFGLNAFGPAESYYAEALALWPQSDSGRPDLMLRIGRTLHLAGDHRQDEALTAAQQALLDAGDVEAAAEATAFLARAAWFRGDRDTCDAHLRRANELIAESGPSVAKARVLAYTARLLMLAGDADEAIRLAREALDLAEDLGLDELQAYALGTIGGSRPLEDAQGTKDLERAVELALAARSPLVATSLNNLATRAVAAGDLGRADEHYAEGLRLAERFGDQASVRWIEASQIFLDFFLGRWDAALRESDVFIAECEAGSPSYRESAIREIRGSIRLARGDASGAIADHRRALALGRERKDPQAHLPALVLYARTCAIVGDREELDALLGELLPLARDHPASAIGPLSALGMSRDLGGATQELREIVAMAPDIPWKEAAAAIFDGDFQRAIDVFVEIGTPTLEAEARFIAAEELLAAGRRDEGEGELEKALAFFRSVDATFYIQRGEALLAAA